MAFKQLLIVKLITKPCVLTYFDYFIGYMIGDWL